MNTLTSISRAITNTRHGFIAYKSANAHNKHFSPSKLICLTLLLVGTYTSNAQAGEDTTINKEMKEIHSVMSELFPLAVQQKPLKMRQEREAVENLKALQRHVTKLGALTLEKSDAFVISYEMLESHLHHSIQAMENNEIDYALSLIQEVPALCSACHTQDEQVRNFDSSKINQALNSDLLRAEFHFMVRDYDEALLDYHDHLIKQRKIRHQKGNGKALEKILLIYVQIFGDIDNAQMYFERLSRSGKLTSHLSTNVEHWIGGLAKIEKQYGAYNTTQIKDISTLISATLKLDENSDNAIFVNESDKVVALWLRGILYAFLNLEPHHPDTPKVLYWLASVENALDYGVSYQLPELYLKRCIVEYSKHPYAKKCYKQYERYTQFLYTGSGGTHLPLYQKEELRRFEALIE